MLYVVIKDLWGAELCREVEVCQSLGFSVGFKGREGLVRGLSFRLLKVFEQDALLGVDKVSQEIVFLPLRCRTLNGLYIWKQPVLQIDSLLKPCSLVSQGSRCEDLEEGFLSIRQLVALFKPLCHQTLLQFTYCCQLQVATSPVKVCQDVE